jgi:hypothetical protein
MSAPLGALGCWCGMVVVVGSAGCDTAGSGARCSAGARGDVVAVLTKVAPAPGGAGPSGGAKATAVE